MSNGSGNKLKKMGRPMLAQERRDERLVLLLTATEKKVLTDEATKQRRDIAFIVREALNKMFPGISN